jgi:hypothetical protein
MDGVMSNAQRVLMLSSWRAASVAKLCTSSLQMNATIAVSKRQQASMNPALAWTCASAAAGCLIQLCLLALPAIDYMSAIKEMPLKRKQERAVSRASQQSKA